MMSAPRVVAVIQARMGSTRLPGKVLRELGGRAVLGWTVRAAQAARLVDEVIVATSVLDEDDAIIAYAEDLGVRAVRGSADDVLDRFHTAIDGVEADVVVRLTSDCPMLDPQVIDDVVALWLNDRELDYVATTLVRTLPRGLDVELATRAALDRAWSEAEGFHRSHVTSWLYRDGSDARRAGIVFAPTASDLRITLDVEEDLALLTALTAIAGDRIVPHPELIALLRAHPEIAALNAEVEQKALEQG